MLDLKNQNILITGAAGTIGSALIKFFSKNKISCIGIDRNENDLYLLSQSIQNPDGVKLILGELQENSFLEEVFANNNIDIIIHTAAYKQVSLMEDFPHELVKNNLLVSLNLLNFAVRDKVQKFIYLSTDKAVYPSSKMGCTKRICELLVDYYNNKYKTSFLSIRFGNIKFSKGSVTDIFDQQIKETGRILLTSKLAERYFITINKAVELIVNSILYEGNNSLLVGNYGEKISLKKYADFFLKKKGITSVMIEEKKELRKGEKMKEDLYYDYEKGTPYRDNLIEFTFKTIKYLDFLFIEDTLSKLNNNNSEKVLEDLKKRFIL